MSPTSGTSTSAAISTYNASDMENFGDVLYPVLIERFLQREGLDRVAKKFAFMAGAAPLQGGYHTSTIRTLFDANARPRDVKFSCLSGNS